MPKDNSKTLLQLYMLLVDIQFVKVVSFAFEHIL